MTKNNQNREGSSLTSELLLKHQQNTSPLPQMPEKCDTEQEKNRLHTILDFKKQISFAVLTGLGIAGAAFAYNEQKDASSLPPMSPEKLSTAKNEELLTIATRLTSEIIDKKTKNALLKMISFAQAQNGLFTEAIRTASVIDNTEVKTSTIAMILIQEVTKTKNNTPHIPTGNQEKNTQVEEIYGINNIDQQFGEFIPKIK